MGSRDRRHLLDVLAGRARDDGDVALSPTDVEEIGETVVVPITNTGLAEVLDDLEDFLDAALAQRPRRLVVDMSAVVHLSSTIVGALLWTRRRCAQRGIEVRLGDPSPRCVDALARVGLLGVLEVEPADGSARSRGRTVPLGRL